MALTEKDLYPSPSWNYVFGIASYADRVGITSVSRLQTDTGSHGYTLCLRRLTMIASHEIGHIFSLMHCLHAKCAMNGGNSLPEVDRCISRLCSECQQKLHWNIGYDNRKRLRELIGFYKKNNMKADLEDAEKDLKLFE